MTRTTSTLLTGALAGTTAALLALGAVAQPSMSLTLYAASALPVLISGLGWGNRASAAAVVVAAVITGLSISPQFALLMAAATLAPAAWISHLANLARPASEIGGPDHLLAWYPLSDILMQLCAMVAAGTVLTGYVVGYGPELVGRVVEAMMSSVAAADPTFRPDPEVTARTTALLVKLLPASQGALWALILFGLYYAASRIVSAARKGLRPREDMPSALKMNRLSLFAMLAGLVLSFLSGPLSYVGATVAGAFGAGFLMAGFATLHLKARGKAWKVPGLILAYLLTLTGFGVFLMVILGLADTKRTVALTPGKPDPNQTPKP